jgi:hypothetical protein
MGTFTGQRRRQAGRFFKITPRGTLTSLFAFNGLNNNSASRAEPIQDTDGNFYGTTYDGGTGTACNGGVCGAVLAGLIQGADGNFYGATEFGGLNPASMNRAQILAAARSSKSPPVAC